MQDFLERHIPDAPGPVVNHEGRTIGTHRGLHRYTLGQRKGIGLPSNTDHEHYVVVRKDFATSTLHVAFERPGLPGLYADRATARDFSWINGPLRGEAEILARIRHRDPSTPARLRFRDDGSADVSFANAQRGIAPGQVLAVYEGQVLRGGGVFL